MCVCVRACARCAQQISFPRCSLVSVAPVRLDVFDVDGSVCFGPAGRTCLLLYLPWPVQIRPNSSQVYLLVTGACAVDESAAHFAGLTLLSRAQLLRHSCV